VSSVRTSVGGAAVRVRGQLRRRQERYVVCPVDGFLFRPLYTSGVCPLCGATPGPEEPPPLPYLVRFDRFRTGVFALALVSAVMSALVLYTYFTH